MKIAELKDIIKDYSSEQLKVALVEIYKAVPKRILEEKSIDEILKDSKALSGQKKIAIKKQDPEINMSKLGTEVAVFIRNAREQNYLKPNRMISKNERPKWRFIFKNLYKQLCKAAANPENIESAEKMLCDMYELLCYSCGYATFNAYDPYSSVGIEQTEFIKTIITLKQQIYPLQIFVKDSLSLILRNQLSRETLYSELFVVLLSFLKTPDAKITAFEASKEIISEIQKRTSVINEEFYYKTDYDYEYEYKNNHAVEAGFIFLAALSDKEQAVLFFEKYHLGKQDFNQRVLKRYLEEYFHESIPDKVS